MFAYDVDPFMVRCSVRGMFPNVSMYDTTQWYRSPFVAFNWEGVDVSFVNRLFGGRKVKGSLVASIMLCSVTLGEVRTTVNVSCFDGSRDTCIVFARLPIVVRDRASRVTSRKDFHFVRCPPVYRYCPKRLRQVIFVLR